MLASTTDTDERSHRIWFSVLLFGTSHSYRLRAPQETYLAGPCIVFRGVSVLHCLRPVLHFVCRIRRTPVSLMHGSWAGWLVGEGFPKFRKHTVCARALEECKWRGYFCSQSREHTTTIEDSVCTVLTSSFQCSHRMKVSRRWHTFNHSYCVSSLTVTFDNVFLFFWESGRQLLRTEVSSSDWTSFLFGWVSLTENQWYRESICDESADSTEILVIKHSHEGHFESLDWIVDNLTIPSGILGATSDHLSVFHIYS
jgi:hypothetical protein